MSTVSSSVIIPELPFYCYLASECYLVQENVMEAFISANKELIKNHFKAQKGHTFFWVLIMHDDTVYLIISGTDDFVDWKHNVDTDFIPMSDEFDWKVHEGFNNSAQIVINYLSENDIYKKGDTRRLTVIGHSLGGAMSTLVASHFADTVDRVVTFGSPRVGDEGFVKHYNDLLADKTIRVVNDNDVVPDTPFRIQGFRHVDHELFLEEPATPTSGHFAFKAFNELTDFLRSEHVFDHTLGDYFKHLILLDDLKSFSYDSFTYKGHKVNFIDQENAYPEIEEIQPQVDDQPLSDGSREGPSDEEEPPSSYWWCPLL